MTLSGHEGLTNAALVAAAALSLAAAIAALALPSKAPADDRTVEGERMIGHAMPTR